MAHAPGSVSLRELQHAMLWSAASLACFTGMIAKQQLRIRWTAPLRELYGLSENQRLQGGPLFNPLVADEDRQHMRSACDSLITDGTSMNVIFHAQVNGAARRMRVIAERVGQSPRVVGFLQEYRQAATHEPQAPVSHHVWQSVGRLTLLDEAATAMAHELNQPLAAIATFAHAGERMLNLPDPPLPKVRQVFAEVSEQALRAGELIRQMRGLIKRHSPSKTSLSVADLIAQFVLMAEPIAKTHHIEFQIADELPTDHVLVDVAQINQVLMILFQNALDAVADEAVRRKTIAVTAQPRDGEVTLAVTDTGKGIAADVAARLFQPFYSTKENGTGLGLTSVRNILESYGSHLQYANLPEGGCRFWFSLRLSQGA
ncbi:MAG TPA: HAMP domain-containing sensor histidine kinase [Steroidobacteraceae bacterium]|nr:HAMP domain-containing sensor histidine kinase [Steroidobacteraceae bacterium]